MKKLIYNLCVTFLFSRQIPSFTLKTFENVSLDTTDSTVIKPPNLFKIYILLFIRLCIFFSPKIRSSLPNEYVRGTATVAGSITTAQYAELPHSTNPLAPSPPFTTADPKIESQVARRYDSLRNGNMSFSSSVTLTSSCSQAVVASEEATAILGSWVIRGDDSLGAETSERCSSR